MATLGTLVTNVVAKTKGFESGMKRSEGATKKFGKATDLAKSKFAGFAGSLAAGLGFRALIGSIKSTLKSIDTLAKVSDSIGIATEKLVGLRFAAEQTGLDVEGLDKALIKMVRSVGEAERGTGVAKDAFKELGLSADVLGDLTPDKQFLAIAEAIAKTTTTTDKATLSYQIFGRQGVALVNTLDLGAEGLEEFQRQAEAAGIAITRIDAAKIEEANDAINKMSKTVEGLKNEVVVGLSPAITEWARLTEGFFTIGLDAGRSPFIRAKNQTIDLSAELVKLERQEEDIFGFRSRRIAVLKEELATAAQVVKQFEALAQAEKDRAVVVRQAARERADLAAIQRKEQENINTAEKFELQLQKEIFKIQGQQGVAAQIRRFERELIQEDQPTDILFETKELQKQLALGKKLQKRFDDETIRIRAATKARQELAKSADALRESLRSPFEDAQIQIKRWAKLLDEGLIKQKTFDKATQKLLANFVPAQEDINKETGEATKLVGAIGRGTVAEASFITRQKFGLTRDPQDRVIKKHEEEIAELKEQKELLAKIAEGVKERFVLIRQN